MSVRSQSGAPRRAIFMRTVTCYAKTKSDEFCSFQAGKTGNNKSSSLRRIPEHRTAQPIVTSLPGPTGRSMEEVSRGCYEHHNAMSRFGNASAVPPDVSKKCWRRPGSPIGQALLQIQRDRFHALRVNAGARSAVGNRSFRSARIRPDAAGKAWMHSRRD